jgi:para-aminobenzoate synthetase component I
MIPPAFQRMNELGAAGKPFLFVLDFDLKKPIVLDPDEAARMGYYFTIHGISNHESFSIPARQYYFDKHPVSYQTYLNAFQQVQQHIKKGNTYLINLTFPTPVSSNLTLREVYYYSKARYKVLSINNFIVFSPEKFVQIANGKIHAFPMKGTMDARLKNAEKRLLENKKELAEHYTIVDLIRNDLGMVSDQVAVERFRYIEKITTNYGSLLQASSHISGILPSDYKQHIGNILYKLLPAGSITGAPKEKTVEIIREAENYDRGYYTGVVGYFDGTKLDSGVMIRYLEHPDVFRPGEKMKTWFKEIEEELIAEKKEINLIYKSGGGITSFSKPEDEYQEMKDKIYVPVL